MAHLMFCLRRLPHLSRADFQAYWRDVHGPLVRERAEALGISGYVQSHALSEELLGGLAAQRGSPPAFDGIAQLWWHERQMTDEQKAVAKSANAELLADERRFIDLQASPIFLVEDHEVVRMFVESRA